MNTRVKRLSSGGKLMKTDGFVSAPEIEVSTPTAPTPPAQLPSSKRIPLRTLPVKFEDGDQTGTHSSTHIDVKDLERDLLKVVKGEVRFDGASRAMYAHDASNYRMPPIGVVIPRDRMDVIQTVAVARKHGVPIHARGGGTAIPGQGVNAGLMIDFSKYMNAVLEIDPEKRTARVEPGVVHDELQTVALKHNLIFGPDPATHSRCTIGGMIGNNSCGMHSVMAGRTADNIEEMEVLLYDGTILRVGPTSEDELEASISEGGRKGEIYWKLKTLRDKYADEIRRRFPKIPRRVSGFNLDDLLPENGMNIARALIGSECTCALVLEATVRLVDAKKERVLVLMGFADVFDAADWVPEGLKFKPVALEGMDDSFIEDMEKKGRYPKHIDVLPPGKAWLFVEFGSDTFEDAQRQAQQLIDDLKTKKNAPPAKIIDDKVLQKGMWDLREEGLGATAKVPGEPENHEGWEDTAVHPDMVGAYLRDFKKLLNKYGYEGALYGHFGDGCVHTRLNFDLETAEGIEKYHRFTQEGADLVVRYNGSLSGEHGDGQARGELLSRMFGDELVQAFAEFKSIWDPDWMMNPGKVIAPYSNIENLTRGERFNPPDPKTHFQFPSDKYSFAEASLRCVGAGVCRRKEKGTMCPSYKATLEEKHSTRGRARLLYEMLQGETVKGGWKSEEVKEALDLCLSCKGCKEDCPVQVDMATYKAEFLSHYYEGRLRPRNAYLFGLIHVWARFASWAPELANLATHVPGLRFLAKRGAGIAEPRDIPSFAPYTFKEWFRLRKVRRVSEKKVILWPDTFNDHFHPTTAQAAVEVLEHAGFEVVVPMQDMCCGRPLYDYGMLDMAKRWLLKILSELKDEIETGIPIVVLEPSCASVFKEEMGNLFPHNIDALRLSKQIYLLSDFLAKHAPDYQPPKLNREAVVHGHCHHKAIQKMEAEEEILGKMGVRFEHLDSGCCGMAGAFGFEEGQHYDVSMAVGEQVLLPAVRKVSPEALVIADGFSCREQIKQTTDRQALHLAQVMQMALREGEHEPTPFPERKYVRAVPPKEIVVKRAVVYGTIAAVIGTTIWALSKRKK